MSLIADFLLLAGAGCAGFYCFILSRRLSRFTDLENGVGGAVAVLSMQVDDLTKVLNKAHVASVKSAKELRETTTKAENVAARLELMLASMHDLPSTPEQQNPQMPSRRARSVTRSRRVETEDA